MIMVIAKDDAEDARRQQAFGRERADPLPPHAKKEERSEPLEDCENGRQEAVSKEDESCIVTTREVFLVCRSRRRRCPQVSRKRERLVLLREEGQEGELVCRTARRGCGFRQRCRGVPRRSLLPLTEPEHDCNSCSCADEEEEHRHEHHLVRPLPQSSSRATIAREATVTRRRIFQKSSRQNSPQAHYCTTWKTTRAKGSNRFFE